MAELTESTIEPLADSQEAANPPKGSVRLWQAFYILLALLFVGVLTYRLWQTRTSGHRADGVAPDWEFTTFEGETIKLEDLRGKGIVLNFWASWCDPCRAEADLLEQTWRREKENGVVFIGLDYLDQEPAAQAYLQEYNITYPNGPDLRSQVARRYGIKGVPETFFIDPKGNITQLVIGPIASEAQLEQYLAKIRPQK